MEEIQKATDSEAICRRCGRCCHRKEVKGVVRGKVVFTKDICPHLVKEEDGSALCSVYGEHLGRVVEFDGHPPVRCISSEEAFRIGALPQDCPYVYFYLHGNDKKFQRYMRFQQVAENQDWVGMFPKPKENCKHCYGRGYSGRNALTREYVPCVCVI